MSNTPKPPRNGSPEVEWEMVCRISGIPRRINRESTTGRTIHKLSLMNRSSLGVLDNPPKRFDL